MRAGEKLSNDLLIPSVQVCRTSSFRALGALLALATIMETAVPCFPEV